jgi:predicted amidohydrolase
MPKAQKSVRVAVVQAAPVLFDREASVAKVAELTAEAAGQGAQLVLFPEAFIPAYPRGLGFGTVVGSRKPAGRQTFQRYWEQAVDLPGRAAAAIGAAAREHGVYLAIVSPLGEVLAGPVFGREEILVADLDLGEIPRSKLDFDVVGHYARSDVFRLQVNENPMPPVVPMTDNFEG